MHFTVLRRVEAALLLIIGPDPDSRVEIGLIRIHSSSRKRILRKNLDLSWITVANHWYYCPPPLTQQYNPYPKPGKIHPRIRKSAWIYKHWFSPTLGLPVLSKDVEIRAFLRNKTVKLWFIDADKRTFAVIAFIKKIDNTYSPRKKGEANGRTKVGLRNLQGNYKWRLVKGTN